MDQNPDKYFERSETCDDDVSWISATTGIHMVQYASTLKLYRPTSNCYGIEVSHVCVSPRAQRSGPPVFCRPGCCRRPRKAACTPEGAESGFNETSVGVSSHEQDDKKAEEAGKHDPTRRVQDKSSWTYRVEIGDGLDLLVVIRPGQLSKAFWVKLAAVWEQLGAVLLGQLRAERVDGDDEGSPVSLELQHRQEVQCEDRK